MVQLPKVNQVGAIPLAVVLLMILALTTFAAVNLATSSKSKDVRSQAAEPTPLPGFGKAIKLSGTDANPQYITINSSNNSEFFRLRNFSRDSAYTIESSFKPDYPIDTTESGYIIVRPRSMQDNSGQSNDYAISYRYSKLDNGDINETYTLSATYNYYGCIETSTSYGFITSKANFDNWRHIAAVIDNSYPRNMNLYLDGKQIATKTFSDPITLGFCQPNNPSPILIGGGPAVDWNKSYFHGLIDDVRISTKRQYTGNYIVPTSPFISDSDTYMILHFDSVSNNLVPVITPQSNMGLTATRTGNILFGSSTLANTPQSAPLAPFNFKQILAVYPGTLRFQWDSVSYDQNNYQVTQQDMSTGQKISSAANISPADISAVLPTWNSSHQYRLTVEACNEAGCSPSSNELILGNAPTPTPSPTIPPTPKPEVTFDVNHDGKISAVDALCVARKVVNLPGTAACPDQNPYPDPNGDGTLDSVDALCILRSVAGFETTPACAPQTSIQALKQKATTNVEYSLSPSASVQTGGTITTNVVATSVVKTGAWNATITYPATLLQVTSCDTNNSQICDYSTAGTLKIIGSNANGLPSGSVLAKITFTAKTVAGTATISVNAKRTTDANTTNLSPIVKNTAITITSPCGRSCPSPTTTSGR